MVSLVPDLSVLEVTAADIGAKLGELLMKINTSVLFLTIAFHRLINKVPPEFSRQKVMLGFFLLLGIFFFAKLKTF